MPTFLRVLALLSTAGLVALILDVVRAPSAGWLLIVAAVSVFYLLWVAALLVQAGRNTSR